LSQLVAYYDESPVELLAALRAPGQDVFLNDVIIGADGAAYFTTSNDPQVFRVADDGGAGRRASGRTREAASSA